MEKPLVLPKIVIPSHKRADRVKTTKIVADPIVCVAESQEAEYREHNPDIEVVTHPDSVIGLPPKLQWIYERFGNVFFLDDDIVAVKRVYEDDNSRTNITDKELVRDIIMKTAIDAQNAGAYLYGFSKDPNPLLYNAHDPIVMSGYVTGCATGVWASPKLRWDCRMKIKGDIWISCLNAYYHRKIWRDTRFCFVQEKTFKNAGGLAEIRNTILEKEMYDFLKEHFGEVIQLKQEGALRKKRHEFEISMKVPF